MCFFIFIWHADNIPSSIFICIHQLYLMQHPGYIGFQGLIICVYFHLRVLRSTKYENFYSELLRAALEWARNFINISDEEIDRLIYNIVG